MKESIPKQQNRNFRKEKVSAVREKWDKRLVNLEEREEG